MYYNPYYKGPPQNAIFEKLSKDLTYCCPKGWKGQPNYLAAGACIICLYCAHNMVSTVASRLYSEGHGDLVSRLILNITSATMFIGFLTYSLRAPDPPSRHPWMSKYNCSKITRQCSWMMQVGEEETYDFLYGKLKAHPFLASAYGIRSPLHPKDVQFLDSMYKYIL